MKAYDATTAEKGGRHVAGNMFGQANPTAALITIHSEPRSGKVVMQL